MFTAGRWFIHDGAWVKRVCAYRYREKVLNRVRCCKSLRVRARNLRLLGDLRRTCARTIGGKSRRFTSEKTTPALENQIGQIDRLPSWLCTRPEIRLLPARSCD